MGEIDKRLYQSGVITRPLTSKLGEREPTRAEIAEIQKLVMSGEITATSDLYPVIGVDVSEWQGLIDWGKMADKVYFAIIRSCYGAAGLDDQYERNLAEAHRRGRAVGIYHYLKPAADWRRSATLFYNLWRDSGSHILPSFDLEETGGLDKNDLNNWMEKYLKTFYELAGREDVFGQAYSSAGFMDSYVMTWPTHDWPKKLDWWVASWTTAATPVLPRFFSLVARPMTWEYWQYTSRGGGIEHGAQSRGLDLNRSRLSLAAYNAKYNLNLQPIGDPTPPPEPGPEPGCEFQMRVVVDTLNVRSGPGVAYSDIGDVRRGDILTVRNIGGQNAWVEIEPGKFVCVQLNSTRFLEKV